MVTVAQKTRIRFTGAGAPSKDVAQLATSHPFDVKFLLTDHKLHNLPEISLKPQQYANWTVKDQGDRPTCTAFAASACVELLRAGQGDTFNELSPQFLYWYMRRTNWPDGTWLPQDWAIGATKLKQAGQILKTRGICPIGLCDYDSTGSHYPNPAHREGDKPPTQAADMAALKVADAIYGAPPFGQKRGLGIARKVYDLLHDHGHVAIAAPVFGALGDDTYQNAITDQSGVVRDRNDENISSGHTVCVVGFQPAPSVEAEPTGGWFIFRNSLGTSWATHPRTEGKAPRVPHEGYGAVSATYVEKYCWEYLCLTL